MLSCLLPCTTHIHTGGEGGSMMKFLNFFLNTDRKPTFRSHNVISPTMKHWAKHWAVRNQDGALYFHSSLSFQVFPRLLRRHWLVITTVVFFHFNHYGCRYLRNWVFKDIHFKSHGLHKYLHVGNTHTFAHVHCHMYVVSRLLLQMCKVHF